MTVVDVGGRAIPRFSRAEIREFVAISLAAMRRRRVVPFPISEVSIVFVDDDTMTELNRSYRGRTKTTDVLTFPAADEETPPGSSARPLGEIIISVDQAKRQAREQRHALATEIRYLILHGLLHALGYDHETDDGEMHRLELRLRDAVGLD